MPDDRRQQDQRDLALNRFWHELARPTGDPDAAAGEIDPELAETVRLLRAMAQTPPPVSARERVRRGMTEHFGTHQNGKETSMLQSGTLTLPGSGFGPNGRYLPQTSRARTARSGVRWLSVQFATVLLLLVTLFFGYLAYRDSRPAAVPTVQVTPTTVATPDAHVWPMFGGNAARDRNASGPGPTGQPATLWMYPAPGAPNYHVRDFDRGALADGVLYLSTSTGLVALDAATGREIWRVEGYGDAIVVDGDGLIVHGDLFAGPSLARSLARVRRVDGSVVWTVEQGKLQAAWNPVIADGVGYTPSGSDFVAFDPATGQILWRLPLSAPASRGASVADGIAVLGDEQGTIYGISLDNRDVVWTYDTASTGFSHPTLANGSAYLFSIDNGERVFLALDAATGALKWRFVAPDGAEFRGPAVDDSTVYVGTVTQTLYALDADTGAVKWSVDPGGTFIQGPTLADGVLYTSTGEVGFAGTVYAVDAATGAVLWSVPVDTSTSGGAIVVDGIIYVGTDFGTVYAIGGTETAATEASPTTLATAATGTATVAAAVGSSALPTFAWATRGSGEQTLAVPLDVAVAPDGKVWVEDTPGEFKIFDENGNYLETWGSPGTGPEQFLFTDYSANTGSWAAFAPDGSLYVADLINGRVEHYDADRQLINTIGAKGTGDGQFTWPGGIAFEPDGTLLVTDGPQNDIQHFAPDGTFLDRFDGTGTTDGPLGSPAGVALDQQGRLFVVENVAGRVRVFDQDHRQVATLDISGQQPPFWNNAIDVEVDSVGNIYITDQNNGLIRVFGPDLKFKYQWGSIGEGDARLVSPGWLGLGPDGAVYVTDDDYGSGNGRLVRFNLTASGALQPTVAQAAAAPVAFVWSTSGDAQHRLFHPTDVAIDPAGRLWVISLPGEFFIFDLDGNLLETWGSAGSGDGQFAFALGEVEAGIVLFAPDGGFYVADIGNFRIQQFDKDRRFVRAWGDQGSGDGQFLAAAGIAFDAQGNLLASDFLRHDVQRFAPDGRFLGKFGGEGAGQGQFENPAYVTVATDGRIWIGDWGNNRVQVFDPDGTFAFAFGQPGNGNGGFSGPAQVAFDEAGHVFVTDQNNHLVQVFDAQGRFLFQFGGFGAGDGQFNAPNNIAINRGGSIYVTDWHGNRIEKFKIVGPFPAPAEATPTA